jgi:hypothetical protein
MQSLQKVIDINRIAHALTPPDMFPYPRGGLVAAALLALSNQCDQCWCEGYTRAAQTNAYLDDNMQVVDPDGMDTRT